MRQQGYYEEMPIYNSQAMSYPGYSIQFGQPMGVYQYPVYTAPYSDVQLVQQAAASRPQGWLYAQPVQRKERPAGTLSPPKKVAKIQSRKPVEYSDVNVMANCELPESFHKEVPGCFDILGRGNLPSMCFPTSRMVDAA
jgi:hypothetical protein